MVIAGTRGECGNLTVIVSMVISHVLSSSNNSRLHIISKTRRRDGSKSSGRHSMVDRGAVKMFHIGTGQHDKGSESLKNYKKNLERVKE